MELIMFCVSRKSNESYKSYFGEENGRHFRKSG